MSVFNASPILGEVMPEEVVGSQFDGFLRRDKCQVHCRTWEEKKGQRGRKEKTKNRQRTENESVCGR